MSKLTAAASVSIVIAACGGSASDDSEYLLQPEDSPQSQIPSSNLNGVLSGRLIFEDDGAQQLDLTSGLVSPIEFADTPFEYLQRSNLEPPDDDVFISVTGSSAAGYTYTLPECKEVNPDAQILGVYVQSCVFFYNHDLSVRRRVNTIDIEVASPPLISPSGKYAIMNEVTGTGSGQSILYLVDIDAENGEFFKESKILERLPDENDPLTGMALVGASALAWTPNDEIVYSLRGTSPVIKITQPGSLTVEKIITLPKQTYGGYIDSLDVSPDGSKILIGYVPDTGALVAGVLLLELSNAAISVPAIVQSESSIVPLGDLIEGSISNPRWSPDGQWIIVREGFDSHFGVLGTYPALFAVPADKSRTILTTTQPTDAILVRSEDSYTRGNLVDHWTWATTFSWTE